MLTMILASAILGGWTGGPLAQQSFAPPTQPNSAVGCDPCKGVRTPPSLPNNPQLVCSAATAGDSGVLGCSAPPVTGPGWTFNGQ
jgi:hypothetical protein